MNERYEFRWPGYTLKQYLALRRQLARDMVNEAKLRANQIEQECDLLETSLNIVPASTVPTKE